MKKRWQTCPTGTPRMPHVPHGGQLSRPRSCSGSAQPVASDPCPTHWQALKRVFRYIDSTWTHGIEFQTSDNDSFQDNSDADWADDIYSRCSTCGYAFMMNNG